MEEIRITLETLYDLLRNEKKWEDLQKISDSFFFDVVVYLKEKVSLLEKKRKDDDLFAAGEKEKIEYELRSIRRILKELYEKREKKIIDIALNRSRTQSNIIDTGAMLKEEKEFYDYLTFLLDGYRKGILLKLFNAEMPDISLKQAEVSFALRDAKTGWRGESKGSKTAEIDKEVQEGDKKDLSSGKKSSPEEACGDKGDYFPKDVEDGLQSAEQQQPYVPLKLKRIRFVHAVPSFIWKDLKEYGPFEEGEETEIDELVADLIIRKGRAEEI